MLVQRFLGLARKHWLVVAITTVLVTAVVALFSILAAPVFKARASVFVSLPVGNTPGELAQGSTYTQNQMESFAQLAQRPLVLDPVLKELGIDMTIKDLARNIEVAVSGDTVILEITASSTDPQQAADLANSVAKSLSKVAREVSPKRSDGQATVELSLVEKAVKPEFQSSPNKKRNVALGLLGGLMLGLALAALRERIDTKARTVGDITGQASAPVLAEVPASVSNPGSAGSVWITDDPLSPAAESFRRLRTNLDFLGVDHRPLTAVVTSSVAGEGKSTICLNLAFACARTGDRVLLVDADLRRPMVAKYLGLVGNAGLTTVLTERATVEDVVQRVGGEEGIDVITSGVVPPNPAELLGSNQMKRLIAEVGADYDVILFDAPPMLPVVDASVLGRSVAGSILVCRLDVVTKESIGKSVSMIEQAGTNVLGLVVNGVSRTALSYGQNLYSYEPVPQEKPKRRRRQAGQANATALAYASPGR